MADQAAVEGGEVLVVLLWIHREASPRQLTATGGAADWTTTRIGSPHQNRGSATLPEPLVALKKRLGPAGTVFRSNAGSCQTATLSADRSSVVDLAVVDRTATGIRPVVVRDGHLDTAGNGHRA